MGPADILNRWFPPSGNHQRLPEEIPAAASYPTVTFRRVEAKPATEALPAVSLAELTEAWPSLFVADVTRTDLPVITPKPFTSQPRFDRDALVSMRRDYAELPIFRQTAGDRFTLHHLAMRAPRNDYEGNV